MAGARDPLPHPPLRIRRGGSYPFTLRRELGGKGLRACKVYLLAGVPVGVAAGARVGTTSMAGTVAVAVVVAVIGGSISTVGEGKVVGAGVGG